MMWNNVPIGSFISSRLNNFIKHIFVDQDDVFAGQHMRRIQAKWDRLTTLDLVQIKTKAQLIARLEEQYGMTHDVAAEDVEIWSSDRRS